MGSAPSPIDIDALVSEVDAFVAHLEGRRGALAFGSGKTLRPERLRALLTALSDQQRRIEELERERFAPDGVSWKQHAIDLSKEGAADRLASLLELSAAQSSEAKLIERERIARAALEKIANTGQSREPDHWKYRCMARDAASEALSAISKAQGEKGNG